MIFWLGLPTANILTNISLRMKWSGFNAIYRREVIEAAVVGYDRLLEMVDRGERPLHRPREWNAAERRRKSCSTKQHGTDLLMLSCLSLQHLVVN